MKLSVLFSDLCVGSGHLPRSAFAFTRRSGISPTHVLIEKGAPSGLDVTSMALCEQIRTVDRARLAKHIGRIDPKAIPQLDEAIVITLAVDHP